LAHGVARRRFDSVDLQQVRDEIGSLRAREFGRLLVTAREPGALEHVHQRRRRTVVEVRRRLPDAAQRRCVDARQTIADARARQRRERADVVQRAELEVGVRAAAVALPALEALEELFAALTGLGERSVLRAVRAGRETIERRHVAVDRVEFRAQPAFVVTERVGARTPQVIGHEAAPALREAHVLLEVLDLVEVRGPVHEAVPGALPPLQ
jgi:hypothetical protein